jgi:very-short-patch-repair endonuclease
MPKSNTTSSIQSRVREMRHDPTEAEAKLWSQLRAHRANGIHFRRQHPIGPYIVDFCAVQPKLIIEVDGSGHLEQEEYDHQRTEFLETKGYRVLRFWNNEVLGDVETVMGVILETLKSPEQR